MVSTLFCRTDHFNLSISIENIAVIRLNLQRSDLNKSYTLKKKNNNKSHVFIELLNKVLMI